MAKTQSKSQTIGLTRGKAALIGVLAIALLGVLYIQYGRSGGADSPATVDTVSPRGRTPGPARAAAQNSATANAEPDGDTQDALVEFNQAKWKSPDLPAVIAYDPFALPAAFPQPPKFGVDPRVASGEIEAPTAAEDAQQRAVAFEELRLQLEELKQRGVHVIISQNDQYVAMIGDRLIHVGDEIGNGFMVTEIDPNGVRVERKAPE